MRVTRMCPSVSPSVPTSDEREESYQHHRWGYSAQTHWPDNFINEYFCTNISTRLKWLLGWARVFIQFEAQSSPREIPDGSWQSLPLALSE